MYITVKNRKVKLVEANTFWERLKGLKFVLGPLTYGVRFPNKKSANMEERNGCWGDND